MGAFNEPPEAAGSGGSQVFVGGGGMKVTSAGFDADGKKVVNLAEGIENSDAITKHQLATALVPKVDKRMEDHLDANYHSILNIQTAGDNDAFSLFHGKTVFLTTDGAAFNAKNQKVINLATDENEDSSTVNMLALKKFHPNSPPHTHEVIKDIDLKEQFDVINAEQHDLDYYKTHYNNLMPYEDIKSNFVSRKDVSPMENQLDMAHFSIFNLKDPYYDAEAATKGYVDSTTTTIISSTANSIAGRLSLSGGKMTGQIDMGKHMIVNLPKPSLAYDAVNLEFLNGKVDNLKNIMNKKAITATSHPKDEFRYLMEDEDESSSEANISVDGIVDFAQSPHLFNKKTYALKIDK